MTHRAGATSPADDDTADAMGTAVPDISMSLDGFITGPHDTARQPLGEGGQRRHDWLGDTTDHVDQRPVATTGAIVAGQRTYDLVDEWGGSHPVGTPVFVLTHRVPEQVPTGATPLTFVTDGIEGALAQARAVAGDQDVYVMGGAEMAQQYVRSGLLDEMVIHLVPVLLGDGIRLFDNLGPDPIELEQTQAVASPDVVHLSVPPRRVGARRRGTLAATRDPRPGLAPGGPRNREARGGTPRSGTAGTRPPPRPQRAACRAESHDSLARGTGKPVSVHAFGRIYVQPGQLSRAGYRVHHHEGLALVASRAARSPRASLTTSPCAQKWA
jgi:dihydrofolate reductase